MTGRASSVAIVGGGLAGMAAAVAAAERGLCVELFEAGPRLGGRAGSLLDAVTAERIDYCPHVAMGCCRTFLDFCRRTGIEDCFERSTTLHCIAPDGRQYDLAASRFLPAPLHLLPGLMNLKYLSLGERWRIVWTLAKLMRAKGDGTIGAWLESSRHAPRAVANDTQCAADGTRSTPATTEFVSVVLTSALGETLDHASLAAAQQVFREGFLASRDASDLILPRTPLGDVLHDRVGKWLADRGVPVHCATPVRHVEIGNDRVTAVVLADGQRRAFDQTVVAVPWRIVRSLVADDFVAGAAHIEPAAITAVHLWFDRPVTALPHAVLIGRRSQWAFARPCGAGQQHVQVVISASHRMPQLGHDALLGEVRRELEAIWPAAADARLVHGRVIAQPTAVFSMTPEVDRYRPSPQTPIAGLTLAGDWTATGWPATMEGAVRSGYRAVECLENREG